MENSEKLEKLYYSISEVSGLLNVNASLIRFWEKEFGNFIKPRKNRNGKRMFSAVDITNLKQIYYLTKEKGYTLAGAKNILLSKKQIVDKEAYLVCTLTKVKDFLNQLKDELNKK